MENKNQFIINLMEIFIIGLKRDVDNTHNKISLIE